MGKKTFKIEGMDCASCAMIIESDLEDAGIAARCSYAKESLEVENDGSVKDGVIREVIEKAGYKIIGIS